MSSSIVILTKKTLTSIIYVTSKILLPYRWKIYFSLTPSSLLPRKNTYSNFPVVRLEATSNPSKRITTNQTKVSSLPCIPLFSPSPDLFLSDLHLPDACIPSLATQIHVINMVLFCALQCRVCNGYIMRHAIMYHQNKIHQNQSKNKQFSYFP
jgi:hypothetical protein